MKNCIAITTSSFAEFDAAPLDLLVSKRLQVKLNKNGQKLAANEIIELCKGCVGIIAGTELYDSNILSGLKGLKVISRCGTGMENIDLKSAAALGIKVLNTPDAPVVSVAELTVGLMFDLLRNISSSDRNIRQGIWKKQMGGLLREKNIGLIGFGRIGKKVAELLSSLGAHIAYYDIRNISAPVQYLAKTLPGLLCWADIISLHTSSQLNEKPLIGEEEFKIMKNGVLFVNTSRGQLVDEEALFNALLSGKVKAAALDVYKNEPYSGRLKELNNVVFTAHISSYAKEARIEMEMQAADNLIRGLNEEVV